MRIFDTRFYLAKAPQDAPDLGEADGAETTRMFWTTPRELLAEADAGAAHIIFPTRRNLERLAAHSGHAALEAHAKSIPVAMIPPWTEEIGKPACGERVGQAGEISVVAGSLK